MRNFFDSRGFTILEIILVIAAVVILVTVAIPSFIHVSIESRLTQKEGVVHAVRAGIALSQANDSMAHGTPGRYPEKLDNALPESVAGKENSFFSFVTEKGIEDPRWSKGKIKNTYRFYDGTQGSFFVYNPETGGFSGK